MEVSARTKPHNKQLEVSVFGPGRGESIVVHIGNDKWVIIDSCYDKDLGEPAALAYLRSINVDIRRNVVLIISTHWHDDHIRGLSKCVEECESASFCCSEAFNKKSFFEMISAYDVNKITKSGSGTSEIVNVFNLLSERGESVLKAIADRPLYKAGAGELECAIVALSPSDEQVDAFHFDIAGIKIKVGDSRKRAPSCSPNHSCVVTLIQVGEQSILLGADHEETTSPNTGWTAIVNSTLRPKVKCSVYKVAHHGSENGHVDAVWEEMLIDQPHAVLTPYRNSKLPKNEMIEEILKKTETAYSTARNSDINTNVKRDKVVDKMIKETVGKIKTEPKTGHVRIRNRVDGDINAWESELFSGACHLRHFSCMQ